MYTPDRYQVSRLELEYEIQCKIISAAVRLSKEKGIDKSIKKERLEAAQRAQVNYTETRWRFLSIRRQPLRRLVFSDLRARAKFVMHFFQRSD